VIFVGSKKNNKRKNYISMVVCCSVVDVVVVVFVFVVAAVFVVAVVVAVQVVAVVVNVDLNACCVLWSCCRWALYQTPSVLSLN